MVLLFLTARCSLRVAWGGGRYRTVISRAKSVTDALQYWRALSTSIVNLIRCRAGIILQNVSRPAAITNDARQTLQSFRLPLDFP